MQSATTKIEQALKLESLRQLVIFFFNNGPIESIVAGSKKKRTISDDEKKQLKFLKSDPPLVRSHKINFMREMIDIFVCSLEPNSDRSNLFARLNMLCQREQMGDSQLLTEIRMTICNDQLPDSTFGHFLYISYYLNELVFSGECPSCYDRQLSELIDRQYDMKSIFFNHCYYWRALRLGYVPYEQIICSYGDGEHIITFERQPSDTIRAESYTNWLVASANKIPLTNGMIFIELEEFARHLFDKYHGFAQKDTKEPLSFILEAKRQLFENPSITIEAVIDLASLLQQSAHRVFFSGQSVEQIIIGIILKFISEHRGSTNKGHTKMFRGPYHQPILPHKIREHIESMSAYGCLDFCGLSAHFISASLELNAFNRHGENAWDYFTMQVISQASLNGQIDFLDILQTILYAYVFSGDNVAVLIFIACLNQLLTENQLKKKNALLLFHYPISDEEKYFRRIIRCGLYAENVRNMSTLREFQQEIVEKPLSPQDQVRIYVGPLSQDEPPMECLLIPSSCQEEYLKYQKFKRELKVLLVQSQSPDFSARYSRMVGEQGARTQVFFDPSILFIQSYLKTPPFRSHRIISELQRLCVDFVIKFLSLQIEHRFHQNVKWCFEQESPEGFPAECARWLTSITPQERNSILENIIAQLSEKITFLNPKVVSDALSFLMRLNVFPEKPMHSLLVCFFLECNAEHVKKFCDVLDRAFSTEARRRLFKMQAFISNEDMALLKANLVSWNDSSVPSFHLKQLLELF